MKLDCEGIQSVNKSAMYHDTVTFVRDLRMAAELATPAVHDVHCVREDVVEIGTVRVNCVAIVG